MAGLDNNVDPSSGVSGEVGANIMYACCASGLLGIIATIADVYGENITAHLFGLNV